MIENINVLKKLKETINSNFNRNVIMIIGAGASHEAANLPLGIPLADYLVKTLGCHEGAKKVQFEKELDYLYRKYNFSKEDFKTILFALNKIDSSMLINSTIKSLSINYNIINSDIYTIIAKLFINGSLNHIINFNFDEILDKELLKYNNFDYDQIYSDRDINQVNFNDFIKPNYIKPHGSISQPDTLRFQRKDYYKLEEKTNNLLVQIFSEKPVDIILMGFRLKFHDIGTLIGYWLKPLSNIYIIDKEEDVLGNDLSSSFYSGDFIKISDQYSLSDSLNFLVSSKFNETTKILENESN